MHGRKVFARTFGKFVKKKFAALNSSGKLDGPEAGEFVMSTEKNYSVRRSEERGHARHGWLESRHSFSFGNYFDEAHMGFRSLRVINEDRVVAGAGFPTHPHRDMEIFSYVLEGALEHEDSMGNKRRLEPGEIQLMSAGRGVTHSEYNPSAHGALHFLQIWIQPSRTGLEPGYTEWRPLEAQKTDRKVLVISPDGRENSAVINQDAEVHRIRLKDGESIGHRLAEGRGLWFQLIKGEVGIGGKTLAPGDAVATEEQGEHRFTGRSEVEGLLFDLA